ncbi:phospholipase A2 [Streptomyces paludis]|uniref:Sugar-binding protein n=1 Tax=Streptomyces paludis TaxID=2282738 RepID=A0A345HQE2_9ACTN|nr:phospholipase A2 [Streptomyces paludis]AXG78916.1 sugar-binding protein [Streptomyces paludis]
MGSWLTSRPPGPLRSSTAPRADRRLRQIAGALSLLLAVETALIVESTGQAIAATDESSAAMTSASEKPLGRAEATDVASALLMARLQDRKIEVLSERAADSTTWALPSGESQTESYAEPIRVKRDGAWQDIDTSLSDTGANLTPEATSADIAVSNGGDKQLASVSKGDKSFGLGWEDKLPTPTVKDSTASYDLGGGQKLTVTALAQGFSQNVVLDKAPDDAVSYRIPLDLDGLKLSQADSGHLLLKDSGGKLVAEASAPMMWDATKNDASGESEHQAPVDTKIETADDGAQTLVLTPAPEFLATATYPVTVDPTSTLAVTTDTWIQYPDYLDSQVGSQELKSGSYDAGTHVARTYLRFDVSKFSGKHITGATMSLYNYYSATCATTGASTTARRVTSAWDSHAIVWGSEPTLTTVNMATNTGHWGYNSSCPANWSNWTMTAMVQDWANGAANYGIGIRSADQNDSTSWRRFRSANYTTSGYAPKLTVTYNSYPGKPTVVAPVTGAATNDTTPTLQAKASDADGNKLYGHFEVWNSAGTAMITSGDSAQVASGSTFSWTSPVLAQGAYKWRVLSHDGTDGSAWSAWSTLTVDTTAPSTTSIASTDFPANTWTGTPDENGDFTGDFTFTPPPSDTASVVWTLDGGSASTHATTGAAVTDTITFRAGKHTISVRTRDRAGNVSAATAYVFYAGSGASLTAPNDGDRPARRLELTSEGKTTYTAARYQYRRGDTDTWGDIPVADVTRTADGTALTSWPAPAINGKPASLTWNITDTLAEDGPVDIRAVFTAGTATDNSPANTITVDRIAGAAPELPVGPGSLNALTGDFVLGATDTTVFGMSITRTASSRRPSQGSQAAGQSAIFGPQWSSGLELAATGSKWSTVHETGTALATVADGDGKRTGFTATTTGGWKPEPGAEGLTLAKQTNGSYTLTDTSGVISTFTKPTGTDAWQLSSTTRPTDDPANPSTYLLSTVVTENAKQVSRPKYLVTHTSAVSVDICKVTPATKGCRVLEYLYAPATTATTSTLGNYANRVSGIRLWATGPGATAATVTNVVSYLYDQDGRLRQMWDPRTPSELKTEYEYDAAGRVTKFTEPGVLPWAFTYATAGASPVAGGGMLVKASRPTLTQGSATLTNGTATTGIVYDVPLTGTNAPYGMSATQVGDWGQRDVPTDATAVFPSDQMPASHSGDQLTATAYQRAAITYTNASGRQVNTAQPGGHISTTEYDAFGNVVSELTAANRELALGTASGATEMLDALRIATLPTAERANLLSATSVYSKDGVSEIEAWGPLKLTGVSAPLPATGGLPAVSAESELPAREHTRIVYDEGRPTNGSAKVNHQVTKEMTGVQVPGYAEVDVRTNSTAYDWDKGLPTSKTEDPGALSLTRSAQYDSMGRPTLTTNPAGSGTDASSFVTTYWTAGGTGDCSSRPEWADLVCKTAPAAAISGTNGNPTAGLTTVTEYDRHGQIAKVTETGNGTTRTTVTTYDTAGRPEKTTITGNAGAAVQESTTTYNAGNGKIAKTSTTDGAALTNAYDALGRLIRYTDAEGATTSTEYDALNRTVRTASSAPYTTTYEYDSTAEPRGLATKVTDSAAGVFTNVYDGDALTISQQLPGGITMRQTNAPNGEAVARTYTLTGQTEPFFASNGTTSVHKETVERAGLTVAVNAYDNGGRLVRSATEAQDGSGNCALYTYTYNANGTRKSEASATGNAVTGCPTSTGVATSHTYDSAGRIVDAGYVYDGRSRLTASPDGLTTDYFANDQQQRQTVGDRRQTWTLDPAGRKRGAVIETGSGGLWTVADTQKFHYDEADQLVWTQGTAGITRTLITEVDELNGIAAIDADGSVTIELNEATNEGQIQYSPGTGALLVQDGGQLSGSALADQLSGQEVTGSGSELALCMGCAAAPLSEPMRITAYGSPGGSKASATDYWLFDRGLWAFRDEKKRKGHRTDLIWKDDGCSAPWYSYIVIGPSLAYYSSQFYWPCARHDFGYRNYQKQKRTTRHNKDRIDSRFKYDMNKRICEPKMYLPEKACNGAAYGFWYAVNKFGDSAFF